MDLRKYDIILYRDQDGMVPFLKTCRTFASYNEARQWAANEMYKNPDANSVDVRFHY